MKPFVPSEHIAEFNQIKDELTESFMEEEIREKLRMASIPSNRMFFSALLSYGIIQRIKRGYYRFTSPRPVHVVTFGNVYTSYNNAVRRYNKNGKKEESKFSIQDAINLLNASGYIVLKRM